MSKKKSQRESTVFVGCNTMGDKRGNNKCYERTSCVFCCNLIRVSSVEKSAGTGASRTTISCNRKNSYFHELCQMDNRLKKKMIRKKLFYVIQGVFILNDQTLYANIGLQTLCKNNYDKNIPTDERYRGRRIDT